MTDAELKKAELSLRGVPYKDMTAEQHKLYDEVSAVSMIQSILAYNAHGLKKAEDVLEREEKSYHNYLEEHVQKLGRERVLELIQDMIDDTVCVRFGVYTDSEGCSYNSPVYKSTSGVK